MAWRRGGLYFGLATALLGGCAAAPAADLAPDSGRVQVYAVSSTATPSAKPQSDVAIRDAELVKPTPTPMPTPGPLAYVLDFSAERREVTLRVGQRLKLDLFEGPTGPIWLSGVDDARVLLPVAPDGTGVYQALAPGTTLLTANVPGGCGKVPAPRPCHPESGFLFQMRVYVIP